MSAIVWIVLLVLGLCLMFSGFTGRTGSLIAALIAPAQVRDI